MEMNTVISHFLEFLRASAGDIERINNIVTDNNDNLEAMLNDQDKININNIVDMGFNTREHAVRMYLAFDKNAENIINMYFTEF